MFAVDSVCLSTYSNVSCDCWAKAWRPNCALFSHNSNRVQSDKSLNSFYCKRVSLLSVNLCRCICEHPHNSPCRPPSVSSCLTVSLAACLLRDRAKVHVLVSWSVTFVTCYPFSHLLCLLSHRNKGKFLELCTSAICLTENKENKTVQEKKRHWSNCHNSLPNNKKKWHIIYKANI